MLQGSALAREAMSSAAVALYAAAVLPDVPPAVSAVDLALGLFLPPTSTMRFAPSATSGTCCQLQIITKLYFRTACMSSIDHGLLL